MPVERASAKGQEAAFRRWVADGQVSVKKDGDASSTGRQASAKRAGASDRYAKFQRSFPVPGRRLGTVCTRSARARDFRITPIVEVILRSRTLLLS
jgi:hypothetical protein